MGEGGGIIGEFGQVLKMHVHHSDIYISSRDVNCGFISTYERVGDLREK